jgi:hypothetical protein
MVMSSLLLVHVALSLVGIATGVVVAWGFIASKPLPGWTAVFLATTVLTSVTGYFLPADRILPSHIVGAISLVLLAAALAALYGYRLSGAWRWIYVSTAVAALYLNVFVLVVQAFLKVPALHAVAPTQKEPAFALTQGVVLLALIAIGALGVRRFRPGPGARDLRATANQ